SVGNEVLSRDVADCEMNILRRVVTGGTGTGAKVPGQRIFGKTGTTDDRSDAWFIGATQNLVAAVWFGNRTGVVKGAGFGGAASAPTFRAFMSGALDGQSDPGLPPPGPV